MIVVPVLIANCQVSLNQNNGPLTPQTTMIVTAATKVAGQPAAEETHFANRVTMLPPPCAAAPSPVDRAPTWLISVCLSRLGAGVAGHSS